MEIDDKQEVNSDAHHVNIVNEVKRPVNVESSVDEMPSLTSRMRSNPWILSTFILGIVVLVFLTGAFTGNITGGTIISEDAAGQKLLNFYESGGAQGLEIDSVEEISGLYQINFKYQGGIVPVFMTKDGKFAGNLNPISDNIPVDSEDTNADAESVEVSIDDDAMKGDANALVTIIEFSDYECPFCGRHFRETMPKIIKEYVDTGKVKIIFRDFTLSFHTKAQKAAEAAECAGEFGDDKYWAMHDKLFENQNALDIDDLKAYAKELGLDTVKFNKCLDSDVMADEVKADMTEGESYGVSGTPAVFINGRLVSGAQPFSVFKDIIEEELAKFE